MKHAAAILLLTVSLAGAQSLKLRIDPAYPDQPLKTLPMLQAASPILDVYTYEDGVRQTNLTGHSAVWYYGANASAAAFAIMTNTSAGVGYFRFNVPAAKINTNGTFWSTVIWQNASSNRVYAGTGVVQIAATTVTGNPGALDMSIPLNFDLYSLLGVVPELNLPMAGILTNVAAGSGITQSAADQRYLLQTGNHTGTVAGVSASVVATAATNGATVAGHADTAATNALALLGALGVVYEPTGAVARATAAAGVLFQPTGTVSEADTLATVLARGNDANGGAITNVQSLILAGDANLTSKIGSAGGAVYMTPGRVTDVDNTGNIAVYPSTDGTSPASVDVGIGTNATARFKVWSGSKELLSVSPDGTVSNLIVRGSAGTDGGAATVASSGNTRALRVTDSAVSVVAAGVTNALGQLALLDADTNAVASSRLPASLLYSNSVAQTLSATAAPVSGAAVVNALNEISGSGGGETLQQTINLSSTAVTGAPSITARGDTAYVGGQVLAVRRATVETNSAFGRSARMMSVDGSWPAPWLALGDLSRCSRAGLMVDGNGTTDDGTNRYMALMMSGIASDMPDGLAEFTFYRVRGTWARPQALQAGDVIGKYGALGATTTNNLDEAGWIMWYAAPGWGTGGVGDSPGELRIGINADDASNPTAISNDFVRVRWLNWDWRGFTNHYGTLGPTMRADWNSLTNRPAGLDDGDDTGVGDWWTTAPTSAVAVATNAPSDGYVMHADANGRLWWGPDALGEASTNGGQSISAKAPLVASTNGSNVAISYNSTPWTDYVEARIDDATVYGLYGATVVWNTEVRDAGGIHSAGTITPSSTGLVSGVANVFLTKVASGDTPQLRWQRNADTIAYGYRIAMPAAGAAFLNCPMEDYSDSPTNQYRVLVSYNSGPYTNNSTGAGVAAQYSNVRFHRVKNAGE